MKSALRLVIAFLIAFPQSLWANPTVGEVVAGAAGISSSGDTLTVIQTTPNAIINWNSFSINQGELTQFVQPTSMSAALNRVTGGDPSSIYGTLQANGRVFLINPNGITVGPTGVINTQSFVASTLDLDNDSFMGGGALRFIGNSAANLINMGRINALGGDVLLIAHAVQNTGEITASQGTVGLAAGSEVLIQPSGDERVFVKAGAPDQAAVGVDQAGQITAATAELKAAGGNAYALAINNSGVIQATGVERRGGRVYLVAEGGNIALKSGSVIDASGENGGGTVLVGGDTQGLNPDVPNASVVTVEEGATIKADATVNGDGGKVVVWGNDATSFRGTISAKGGAESGNGGNVEVSGGYLDYSGYADLTAANGLLGGLLLDPIDLVISNAVNNNIIGTYVSNGAASNLNAGVLQTALSGANVTVQTGASTGGNGDITVSAPVTWSGSSANRGALTLSAHNNIVVNAALTQTGNGGLTMIANSANSGTKPNASITLNAAVTTAGNQTYTANGGGTNSGVINLNNNVTTSGTGSQTFDGRVVVQNAATTLTAGTGAISFTDTVNGATAGNQALTVNGAGNVTFANTVGATTRLGALSLNGTGTANLNGGTVNTGAQTYNKAVALGSNATLTSNNGAVAFNNTVNGSNVLTVNAGSGDVTFGGIVGGTSQLDGLTVTGSGTTNLNTTAISINGTGNVAFGEKILLGANSTINTNTGDATFSGTVNGANSLTVNAGNGGNITFTGAVGGVNALTSLNLTGTGTTNLNGGAVTTSGAQSYNEAAVLGVNTILNGGPIDFNSTLNGLTNDGQNLTVNAGAANVSFGNVGTTANRRLASVTLTGTGTVDLNGTVNTGGAQNYSQKISLSGNSALTTNNAAITLGNTVNGTTAGGQSLTLNSGNAATNVNSTIGATTRLGALTFSGATTNLNGASINSGAEAFNGAVVLGQNTTLNSNGGSVDFNANLNGASADAQTLTVNAGAGNVSFSNAGTVSRLQAVSVTGTGGLDLNGTINTNGAQSYTQAINLSGNSVLTTNNAAVTLGGAVNANTADIQSLTINAGNAPVSLASVGVTRRLSSFALNNTGGLILNGTINTSQAQTYNEAVTLAGNSGFSTNNQAITLNGAVDGTTAGGQSLTLNAGTANTNLNAALGGITRLGALTINGAGTTNLNTTTINTGAETFNQAVNLQQNVTFNSNGGNVAFNGAVNSDVPDARSLTVNAGAGNVNLGNVGVTRRINSLVLTAGTIGLNGTVNTNAGQTYSQAVTLNGNSTLQTNNTGITLNGTVNGSNTLTLNAGTGDVNLNGAIGNTSAIDALTISGTGATNLNTASIKTNGTGAQTYGEAVNLLQNTTLTTNGRAVTFTKSVDGAKSLTIDSTATGNANDGNVTFGGAVGAGTALSSLIINQSNVGNSGNGIVYINGGAVNTNGAQTYGNEIIMSADTVLNSNGGAFYFNDHVNGIAPGAQGLTVNAGAGNIFFNRRVGGDNALKYLTIGAGTGITDIDTGGIETTGNQLYGQNVALTNDPDFTTTGGNITFMGTINGGHDILMSPVGGNVVFNGAVGNTTSLDSLTITGTGKTTINGGLIRTVNNQSYGEDVLLGADTTINATGAGSIAFSKTINGAKNLIVTPNSGNVTFTGAVGDVTHLTSLTVNAGNNNGTTNLNDSVINTDGNQTYGQKVALGGNETLSSNGGNVLFSNTVNGARTLAVNAGAGNVTFSNTVGNTAALTSLGITGTGTTNLNGNSVRTTGAQTYGENVQLGTDNTLTTTANGSIAFTGTVNGAKALAASVGAGNITFNGAVGNTSPLTSLNLTGTGTTNINGGAVTTTGFQTYGEDVFLGGAGADTTLTSNGGGVTFSKTVNGAKNLIVASGTGDTTFNGAVGNTTPLASLDVTGAAASKTNINGGIVTTTGKQHYGEIVALGGAAANTTLTSANSGVSFDKTVDGAKNLIIASGAGDTTFSGAVGAATALTSLAISGSGTTNLNGTSVRTTGAQTYGENVQLGTDNTLTTTANGSIAFTGTVNGAKALAASVGAGNITFNGAVGNTSPLTSLNLTGTGTTNIIGGAVTTTGFQTYGEDVFLGGAGADTTLTSNGGGVTFSKTVNGAKNLIVASGTGDTTFNGAVGNTTPLASLDVTGAAASKTNINGGIVTTTGKQHYGEIVALGGAAANTTLTSANSGVSFDKTVDGAKNLIIASGTGDTTFSGAVGNTTALASLDVTGAAAAKTNINGGIVTTVGNQHYGEAVLLGTDDSLTSNAGSILFDGTVGGAYKMTTNSFADTTFNGAVNIASLDATAGGLINLNGATVDTTGAQTYNTGVNLMGGNVLTGNTIDFLSTITGANALTTNSTLDTTFNGAVNIAALDATAGGLINLNAGTIDTTGAQTYNTAVNLTGGNVLTGNTIDFMGTITGANALTTDSTLDTTFNGAVNIASLDATAGGLINLNGGTIGTTGAQTYNTGVNLMGGNVLTGNTIDFLSTIVGANALTTNSTLDTTFNGAVNIASLDATAGGLINLNAGTIDTTGAQTYNTAVNLTGGNVLTGNTIDFMSTITGANALTTNSTLDTTFNGAVNIASLDATAGGLINLNGATVDTTGAQTYNTGVNLMGGNVLTGNTIDFLSTIVGANALMTNSTLDTTFNGAVNIASLDATAGGLINLNAGTIDTTGAQTYNTAVNLTGGNVLTGNTIDFMSTITGANALTTNSTLDTTFNGAVNIASLDATAGGLINLNGATVDTTGAQTYNTGVNLMGGNVLTGNTIDFLSTITGANALTTDSGADTSFGGAVNIASLDATAGGLIKLNGGSVVTSGDQNYLSAILLGAASVLTGANASFSGAVDGAQDLTVNAGAVIFGGTVGNGTALNSLTIGAGAGTTYINGGSVTTAKSLTATGNQSYGENVVLGNHTTLSSGDGTVSFGIEGAGTTINGIADGAQDLTINAGAGDVNLFGAVGDVHALRNLTIGDGTGTTDINGGVVNTIGDQYYGQKVRLSADATLASNGGDFNFMQTVNGTVAGEQALTVDSAAGDITFWQDIGNIVPLKSLTLLGTGAKNLYGTVYTYGNQDYWDDLVLLRDLIIYSFTGTVTFHKTVSGGHLLSVNTTTGDINFNGAVGYDKMAVLNPLSELILTGLGLTTISRISLTSGGDVATTGAQSYGQGVFLAADTRLASNGGLITFGASWSGAQTIDVDAGIGGSIALNGGTVNTLAQTYTGAITLGANTTLNAGVQAVTFNGAVSGPGTLSVDAGVIAVNGGSVNTAAQTYNGALTLDRTTNLTSNGGDVTFNGTVVGAQDLTVDAGAGNINLNGGTIDTTGAQTYHTGVNLMGGNVLTGNTIDFLSTIAGANALTTNSTLDTTFNGAVNIASLDATAGGLINLNAGTIDTTGAQTYNTGVNLTGGNVLTGNTIDFMSTITGANALTTNSTLDTTFNGAVNIASLDATAGGLINLNGATVDTTGAQTYNTGVNLMGGNVLTGNTIDFLSTITGANALTTDSGADTSFGGAVNIASLDATAGGLINVNAGTIDTTGAQTYNSAANLTGGNVLTGNTIDFLSTITGANALTTNSTLDTTFNGAVNIASLDATAGGLINLNAGTIDTTGAQTYNSAVDLTGGNVLTGNTIDFMGTITGANALTTDSTLDTTFNGAVNIASLDATAGGLINLNGGTIGTTGAQTYNTGVNLMGGNILTGNTIDFLSTIVGANALTTDSTLDTTFNGAVNIASLDATAGGLINLNAGTIDTTGVQTYNTAVNLTGGNVLTGNTIDFLSTIVGANALTTDSTLDTTFNGAVNIASLDATAGGLINLNGTTVETTGAQTYNTAVNLMGGNVLTGNTIDFLSTISGANALTTDSGADTTFGGAVNIASLDATAGGLINLNGATVDTTGAQTYSGNVVLGDETTLTSGGDVAFNGTVNGAHGLIIDANDITLHDAVGDTTELTSLAFNGTGVTHLDGNVVNTAGSQDYNENVEVGANSTLTSGQNGVNFNGSVNGPNGLTVNAGTGDVTFAAGVGDVARLSSLETSGTGVTKLNLGSAKTSGSQIYGQDLALVADTTLDSTLGDVTFGKAVTGAQTLTVNAVNTNISGGSVDTLEQIYNSAINLGANTALNANGADVTLNGPVSGNQTLTIDAANINMNAGTVNTGAQTYNGELNLVAGAVLTSNDGAVKFNGGVNGAQALTVNAGAGDITFAAGVGDVTRLASLETSGTGTTKLNLGSAKTSGDQTYGQSLALVTDTTLDSSAGGVAVNGGANGAYKLTTNSSLDATLGGTIDIAALDATAGGKINLNGSSVKTSGDQDYRSAVNVQAADTLTSTLGDVSFHDTVDGANDLTVNAGDVTFTKAVGNGTALNSLTIGAGAGTTFINGGAVTTNGAQSYGENVVLGDHTTLASNGGTVSFGIEGAGTTINGIADGAQDLTINADAGDVNFFAGVGNAHALRNLTIGAGSGTTDINGGVVNTIGDQSYGQKVVLSDSALLTSNGGNFNFYQTVNGTTAGLQDLTVDSAAGDITFWDDIGNIVPLKSLTLIGTGAKNLYGTVNTVGNQDYWSDLVLLRDLIINSFTGNVTFHKTVSGGHLLSVNTTTGDVSFLGKVGYGALDNLNPLSSLILTGSGLTTLAGTVVKTTGAQSYGQGVFLAADTRLESNGGLITFGKSFSGLQTLTVDAGIGGGVALNGGMVNTLEQTYTGDITLGANTTLTSNDADLTVNGAVSGARTLTLDAGAGNINLNGGTVNTGAQDYKSAVALGAATTLTSGGDVTFGKAVAGAQTLTVDAVNINVNGGSVDTLDQSYTGAVALGANTTLNANGGDVTLNGAVAGAQTLTIDAANINVNGGSVDTLAQTYTGAVALGANTTLNANGSDVTLNGAVAGAHTLAIDAANINVNGGSVDTLEQTYTGAVALGANATLNANGSDVTLNGAVTGAHTLAIDAANININGGSVDTLDQSYTGAVALGANTMLNANGGDVTLNGAVAGAQTLTIDAANINVNGGSVDTLAQTYTGAVALGANTTLNANGSDVTFNGAVAGAHTLAIDAANINVNGGSVDTLEQTYAGAVVLGANTTLNANGSDVTLNGAVTGAHALAIDAANININGGSVDTLAQTYTGDITLGADTVLKSHLGDVVVNGAVNGGANALVIDATDGTTSANAAGTIIVPNIAGAGDITLNGPVSAGDISLSGYNVAWNAALSARNLRIFGRNIIMGGDVSSYGDNGVLMVADGSFRNAGSHHITPSGLGRFLIYSVAPGNNILGGLTGSEQWSTTYRDGPLPGFLGNGFLYSEAPPVDPLPIFNWGAINNNPNPFGGPFNGGGSIYEDGGSLADIGEDDSASSSDLFSWDLGTMRDAVASPDDSDSSKDPKKKKKKKKSK